MDLVKYESCPAPDLQRLTELHREELVEHTRRFTEFRLRTERGAVRVRRRHGTGRAAYWTRPRRGGDRTLPLFPEPKADS